MRVNNKSAVVAILDELAAEVRRTAAMIRLAEMGLRHVADSVASWPRDPANPDPLITVGTGDPNDPGMKASGQLRRSELIALSQPGADASTLLEQQWIVATYSRWEDHYRPRIATLAGVIKDDVTSDLFGDIRLRRNDVVHHNALASRDKSGRSVLLPRIPEGDPVRMTDSDFALASENVTVRIN